jgi:hypothetical protein
MNGNAALRRVTYHASNLLDSICNKSVSANALIAHSQLARTVIWQKAIAISIHLAGE